MDMGTMAKALGLVDLLKKVIRQIGVKVRL
jgi:hypothetical protein